MQTYSAQVTEIRVESSGLRAAWIACPPSRIPAAGQYLLAWAPHDQAAPLATPIFPMEAGAEGFLALGVESLPNSWEPGAMLLVRGPLGHGFTIPPQARQIALVALGDTAGRLLPLVGQALARDASVALFASCPLPPLSAEVEIHPVGELGDAVGWADWIGLDAPAEDLPRFRRLLDGHFPGCPVQALLTTPMPCGGVGSCGACAVTHASGAWLACKDGPVGELRIANGEIRLQGVNER